MRWEDTNFTKTEFNCPCGCEMPPDIEANVLRVVGELQKFRQHIGLPVKVTSGYRCKKHNASIPNAAKLSKHLTGEAADIKVGGFNGEMLRGYFEALIRTKGIKNGGIGTYTDTGRKNILHYDLRKEASRWRD